MATKRAWSVSGAPDIWYPRYVGDFLADTAHLPPELVGAISLLECHQWRHGHFSEASMKIVSRLSDDAWGIAQASLKHMLAVDEAGMYFFTKLELEKTLWAEKKRVFKEKAEKGAAARWKKNASGTSSGDASSIPEALLEICPSPLPLQEIKKPSQKRGSADSRHSFFKNSLEAYWQHVNPENPDLPWGKADAGQLSAMLAANPAMTLEAFQELLRNRSRSDVNQSDPIFKWIASVSKFSAPLDRFGIPKGVGNASSHNTKTKGLGNLAAVAEYIGG